MRNIQICLEIDEEDYRAYEFEASRSGKSVELLLEEMIRGLYRELKEEEKDGNHEIFFP